MKRLIAIILAALVVLSLGGCKEAVQPDPLVQAYKENAQKHISEGDFESATAILEDGLSKTNNNGELKALLDQVKAQQTQQPEETEPVENPGSGFIGYWENDFHCIGIKEADGKLQLIMVCYSGYFDLYSVVSSVEISAATETKVVFPFDDDNYGNSGNVTLYLEGDVLNYVITDFVLVNQDEEPYGIGIDCGGGSLRRVQEMPLPLEMLEENLKEEPDDADSSSEDEEDIYVGEWSDIFSERATMSIVKTAGKYSIKIEWADSSTTVTTWTMTAIEKQEDGDYWLDSTDCKKTITEYADNGDIFKEIVYENGKAMIYYMDEALMWIDYTEYAGDDCCFEKMPDM